jgi:hypothetical protein
MEICTGCDFCSCEYDRYGVQMGRLGIGYRRFWNGSDDWVWIGFIGWSGGICINDEVYSR